MELLAETFELALTLPPELGDAPRLLAHLRARIADVEARCARDRHAQGRGILGRARVLRQAWHASPTSHEPRRNLRPRVAARSAWARIEALQRNREFLHEYRAAWIRWRVGLPALFPPGTYLLARLVHVPIRGAASVSPPSA